MACASCGAEVAAGARFCAACGTPVAADAGSEAQAPRERKVATLLFADLVGFTALNERHDPEVIESVVGRAFERLSAEVGRYEGVVEKFAGDAMLAVFGVPTVHEDDAERAVRAALEMQAAMTELRIGLQREGQPGLALRIGVETGEVLASPQRATTDRDRMVTGDAVNTAARLEQAATEGEVVVGPGTYAATRDVVEYEELAPIELKGKAFPVPAWRAVRVRTGRGGRRATHGLEAPLIGRDEELALIKETVRRATAEGRPHLLTVLGSAGVGKSRLAWELEKYLDGLPERYHWRKGRCLAYAQTSYSALADALAADASALDDDTTDTVEAKLSARIDDLATGASAAAVEAARAGARIVLGLAAAGGMPRDELFDAWRLYLELVARRAPLVLVLEDIHWADEGLLDFIEFLTRWAEAPIVLLCLARHELLERRPTWAGGLPNASTIVLNPLDAGESERLIGGLLGSALPPALQQRVVDVAEGNPLFAEELIRLLVDRGVVRHTDAGWEQAQSLDEVEIPQSIQALLAARLDSLPSDEKRLSQDAAVVGRIFWDRVLAHLAGASPGTIVGLVRSLRVKELVVPREPSTLTDALEYSFRHVLIRDVAYESLPKRERARKHRAVAAWAEERLGDRADEVVELLAAHYWSALRYEEEFTTDGRELTELRHRTLQYARAAGHRALDLSQHESATRWMRIVVDQGRALGLPPDELAEIVLDYVAVSELYETYEAKLGAVNQALEGLASGGDPTEQDRLLIARLRAWEGYLLYAASSKVDEARAAFHAGLTALDGLGPSEARAALLHRLGWLTWRATSAIDAVEPLERALTEARASGSDRMERWALHDLGLAEARGTSGPGLEKVEKSMRLAQDANDLPLLMRCYINLSSLLFDAGQPERGIALAEEGLERARRSTDRQSVFWLSSNLAGTYSAMGRLAEALPLHEESMAAADALGLVRAGVPEYALTLMRIGRVTEARDVWEAARIVEEHPEPQMVPWWGLLDALTTWPDDPSASLAHLRPAVEEAHAAGAISNLTTAAIYLGRMAARAGDAAALQVARRVLSETGVSASSNAKGAHGAWISGLVDADGARGARTIAATAETLAESGDRLNAADAFADAAWLGKQADVPDAAAWAGRADELYRECSAVPLLELPTVTRP